MNPHSSRDSAELILEKDTNMEAGGEADNSTDSPYVSSYEQSHKR